MSKLYEKITHSDQRTIVRKYRKGAEISFDKPNKSTIILKANVALKVTQQYDADAKLWLDVKIWLDDMVEVGAMRTTGVEDEKQAPLPKVKTFTEMSWFTRIFGDMFR